MAFNVPGGAFMLADDPGRGPPGEQDRSTAPVWPSQDAVRIIGDPRGTALGTAAGCSHGNSTEAAPCNARR